MLESLAYASGRYTFAATAGQLVAHSLNPAAFDPYLYMIGPDGAVPAEDDDGGDTFNARIPAHSGFFQLPTSGTYTIEVTSFEPMSAGDYTLCLSVTRCSLAVLPVLLVTHQCK